MKSFSAEAAKTCIHCFTNTRIDTPRSHALMTCGIRIIPFVLNHVFYHPGQTSRSLSPSLHHYTKQILTPSAPTVCNPSPSPPYLPSNVWSIMNKFIWGKHLTGTSIVLLCVLRAGQDGARCRSPDCSLQQCPMSKLHIMSVSITGEISGSQASEMLDDCLQGYYAVKSGRA
jgi:hypothetical protein